MNVNGMEGLGARTNQKKKQAKRSGEATKVLAACFFRRASRRPDVWTCEVFLATHVCVVCVSCVLVACH